MSEQARTARPGAVEDTDGATGLPKLAVGVLALLAAVAPLAIDMYLPAFPKMAEEFGTSPSSVQLTLTAFVIGLAVGQLVIGPLSDQFGRRPLLFVGPAVFVVASIACALAPSIGLLIGARFVQGFGGAAGVVLSRAVISDRARGVLAAKLFSVLMLIISVAPVAAPLLGGTFIGLIGWRGVFWVTAGLGVLMFVGVLGWIPESLPPARRRTGGLAALPHDARYLLGNPVFVGYTLTFAFSFGTLFAYISASPFVLQDLLGLPRMEYAIVFAANGLGLVLMNAANARLVDKFEPRTLQHIGVGLLISFAALLVVDAIVGPWLWVTVVLFWCMVSSLGLIMANTTTLAIAEAQQAAGAGSAVLGALQFGLGAVVAPLVGLGGEDTAVPMAVTMLASATFAGCALALTRIARSSARDG